MSNEPKDKRPTHIVWQVIDSKQPNGKAFWVRIGAAWTNRDGDGLSVQLNAIPLQGRIQILPPRDDDATPDHDQQAGAQ